MNKIGGILLFISISVAAYAGSPIVCSPLPKEAKSFNINNYNACIARIDQCPKTGPYYDHNCITKTVEKNTSCQSASSIAKAVSASITQLGFAPVDAYQIVMVAYPADGQEKSYILSPKGCLVDTVIDPRKLNPDLKKRYLGKELIVVNAQLPIGKKQDDGSETFTVLLRVTVDCVACSTLGWANVSFEFDPQGDLVNTRLIHFSPEPFSSLKPDLYPINLNMRGV